MKKCNDRSCAVRFVLPCCILTAVCLLIAVITVMQDSEAVLMGKKADAPDLYSFSFVTQGSDPGGTDKDEVYYSDSFFSGMNDEYDHELARASMALSMTAFKEEDAREFLEVLGYSEIVSYRYDQTGDEDKAALVFAYKSAGDKEIITAVVRGGRYGDEWGSNGRIGYEGEAFGYHYGFRKAAEDAVVQLKEYAAENSIDLGNAAVWITGFSRGAAVANVMGALLHEENIIRTGALFDYTFASPSTVSESMLGRTNYAGIYNIVNPLDIVTRLPMNASGLSKTSQGETVRYDWDYVKYGITLKLPAENGSAQMQVVQLLENALAFAARNEMQYVERTQDQVMIPALKKSLGKGARVSKRNVGYVLIDSLPGVADFLKNEINQLDLKAQIYVAQIISGKKSVRLEKEHWPETYWGWMVKTDGLE